MIHIIVLNGFKLVDLGGFGSDNQIIVYNPHILEELNLINISSDFL